MIGHRRTSLCGRILLLLSDGRPRTRVEIHRALGLDDVDIEITARIRDLRKIRGIHLPPAMIKTRPNGGRSYLYYVAGLARDVEAELALWREFEDQRPALRAS